MKKLKRYLPIVLPVFVLTGLLNALVVCHYWQLMSPIHDAYWKVFVDNFHISGFDPLTYYVISDWHESYNVHRHPLLAYMMWPLTMLNQGLMAVTGINCAIIIMAVLQTVMAVCSAVMMYRILREVVGVRHLASVLLTLAFMGFGFVMLSTIVPDHFGISLLLLLITLYRSGKMIRDGREMPVWEVVLLFTVTAGVSLNNGLKVFLAAGATYLPDLWQRLRSAVTWRERIACMLRHRIIMLLVCGMIIPSGLMWGGAELTYNHFVWPDVHARQMKRAKERCERRQKLAQQKHERHLMDSTLEAQGKVIQLGIFRDSCQKADQKVRDEARQREAAKRVTQGEPIAKGEFASWTDISTPRGESIVENFFGESIQLHQEYLLEDQLVSRPVIVRYSHWYNYAVEALIVAAFLIGIWVGRRRLFLWVAMSFFLMDAALHLGLGFGINEVYIMAAHWIFALPIAIGYIYKKEDERRIGRPLIFLLAFIVLWLWAWNGGLTAGYLSV